MKLLNRIIRGSFALSLRNGKTRESSINTIKVQMLIFEMASILPLTSFSMVYLGVSFDFVVICLISSFILFEIVNGIFIKKSTIFTNVDYKSKTSKSDIRLFNKAVIGLSILYFTLTISILLIGVK